jgi:DNA polymerase elongation subunit (family B)
MSKKIVIPPKKSTSKNAKYAGAYVKDPQVGMHQWVMSFDLNSLYPHLIMQYNISPDTFVDSEYEEITVDEILGGKTSIKFDSVMAANGYYYDRTRQGFLPEMMERMYNERVQYKQKMIEAEKELEEINRMLRA